jgi:hypothetical protein
MKCKSGQQETKKAMKWVWIKQEKIQIATGIHKQNRKKLEKLKKFD